MFKLDVKKLWLICLLIMPFFQGLYFYFEVYALTVLVTLLLMWVSYSEKELYVDKFILLPLLVVLVGGLFGLFYAVDFGMALLGLVKWMSYILIYLLIQQIMEEGYKELLLKVVVFSGLIMSFIVLLSQVTGVFSDFMIQKGRLGGFFQYANTFGLYLVICLLLLFIEHFPIYIKVIGGILILSVTVLTFSRGTLVTLAIGVVGLLLIEWYRGGKKLKGISSWLVDSRAISIDVKGKKGLSHKIVIITSIVGLVLALILIRLTDQSDMASRIGNGISSSEFLSRLLYYKDGLMIVAKNPFGLGHMGYAYVQKTYQTGATYYVKFIHNNVLQWLLDYGIIVGASFVGFFLFHLLNGRIKVEHRWLLMLILLHSAMDFDMEFAYIWVIILIMITRCNDSTMWGITMKRRLLTSVTLSVIVILYLYAFFVTIFQYTNHNELALAMYPFYTEAETDLLTKRDLDEEVKLGIARDLTISQPYFVESFAYMRDYAYNSRDYELAYNYAALCIEKNPMNIEHIEAYGRILLHLAYEAQAVGDDQLAKDYIEVIYEIPKFLETQNKRLSTSLDVRHKVSFEMTKALVETYIAADELYQ